jgi:hypothetical protein
MIRWMTGTNFGENARNDSLHLALRDDRSYSIAGTSIPAASITL